MRRKKLRRTDSPSTSCFRQSELQSIFMRMRLFAARPRRFGNHAGRLLDRKPFTGSPGVLLITTQGQPTCLTCRQTILRIMIPRPESWRKGCPWPLSGQEYSLRSGSDHLRVLSVSLVWAGTYPHGWYSIVKLRENGLFDPFTI